MSTKTKEIEKNVVSLKDCKIIGVSSPATIMQIATSRGIQPQDVFVRVRVVYDGKEFSVSNKLRYLGQVGYEKLQNLMKSGEGVNLRVDLNSSFFHFDEEVSVADLFKSTGEKKDYSLAALLGI